ncbi:MAG: GNAT family N-acetyltransferase, partial [Anaerolineae bacterium]|nr:GNAT family N-acetyltransferase [Thermoflexales bacterium]MDW8408627.1 GNAT family N-acetyltransferase [Anaerolineae bacterium]
ESMRIRPADLADIEHILSLDHSYLTNHVWQMSTPAGSGQSGLAELGASEHSVTFRLARLPRQVQTPYPHDSHTLRRIMHRCDYVWVALGDNASDLLGYIGLALVPWQSTAWVPCLAVAPAHRRRGIASQLLQTAIAQARADGLHSITVDVQTKNYPATRLCQTRGFRLAGYSDNYYSASDIALFFAYRIR